MCRNPSGFATLNPQGICTNAGGGGQNKRNDLRVLKNKRRVN